MPKLAIDIIKQTSHNCAVVALTCIDNYFAQKNNYTPIPLHKRDSSSSFYMFSMRWIAKKRFGSTAGELLEIQQVQGMLNDLGYEADICDFKNNEEKLKAIIKDQINRGNPLITFFPVSRVTNLPTPVYIEMNADDPNKETNNHTAVISGYNGETNKVELIYWDKKYEVNLSDLFQAANSLPDEHKYEYYKRNSDKTSKYSRVAIADPNDNTVRSSITPEKNSGFRAKLVIVNRVDKEKIIACRKKLCRVAIDTLIDYSIDNIVNTVPASQKISAGQGAEIYKKEVKAIIKNFENNSNHPQLLKNIKIAEDRYCQILEQDVSMTAALKRMIKVLLVNLATHIIGVLTLGVGFYYLNYQHQKQTGNWLFFSSTRSAESLKRCNIEMLANYDDVKPKRII
jgi:hypothetical protein